MDTRTLCSAGLVTALALAAIGCEGMPAGLGNALGTSGALDEGTIAGGLKEALRVGSERTVGKVSRVDGFLANELIRIAMPDELDKMAKTLRTLGLGRQVDELETSMNRAAEKAAGEATAIFWDAITGLTIADARSVLEGGRHAATRLLRERTSSQLTDRFQPIVGKAMRAVGLSRVYADLADRYNALPLGQKPAIDLEEYVTGKSLDGVFTVLAKEEEKIREDPMARTTELLRRVFK